MANVPNLILIPTEAELAVIAPRLNSLTDDGRWRIELCGFGIATAAARTALLVERHCPQQVILGGIAGSLDQPLPIGEAFTFSSVACYGVGAGSGEEFVTANEMGWPHWRPRNDLTGSASRRTDGIIGDVIEFDETDATNARLLLTACSASASAEDVRLRRDKFPAAAAEDMEGFGVAVACRLTETRLRIVRGISNRAGDRDTKNWSVAQALQSTARTIRDTVG